jgi:hypothetical protein
VVIKGPGMSRKYEIKQKIKHTKLAGLKLNGKKPTKEEIMGVLLDIAKSVKPEKPKDTIKPLTSEPKSIGEILKGG